MTFSVYPTYQDIIDTIDQSRASYSGSVSPDIVFMSTEGHKFLIDSAIAPDFCFIKEVNGVEMLHGAKIVISNHIKFNNEYKWARKSELDEALNDQGCDSTSDLKPFLQDYEAVKSTNS